MKEGSSEPSVADRAADTSDDCDRLQLSAGQPADHDRGCDGCDYFDGDGDGDVDSDVDTDGDTSLNRPSARFPGSCSAEPIGTSTTGTASSM